MGINSGPVVAGVIGRKRFLYDLWGDAVNTASRMESHGTSGRIQITRATYELLGDDFECQPRGTIAVKGKGEMEAWYLVRRRPSRARSGSARPRVPDQATHRPTLRARAERLAATPRRRTAAAANAFGATLSQIQDHTLDVGHIAGARRSISGASPPTPSATFLSTAGDTATGAIESRSACRRTQIGESFGRIVMCCEGELRRRTQSLVHGSGCGQRTRRRRCGRRSVRGGSTSPVTLLNAVVRVASVAAAVWSCSM